MNKNTWIGVVIGIIIIVILGALLLGYNGRHGRNNPYSNTPDTTYQNGTTTSGGTGVPPSNVPPPQTPPPSGTVAGPIAYIGCSNTWQIVGGYHSDGGTKLWAADQNYGGGTATVWGSNVTNSNPYWQEFDKLNAQDPGAKTLWVMICVKHYDSYNSTYNGVVAAINEAKRRIPSIQTVYVTPLNDFTSACSEVGTTGVGYAKQAAAQIIASGLAKQGPVLSTLDRSDTTDGCHPNPQTRLVQGNELLSFFGK